MRTAKCSACGALAVLVLAGCGSEPSEPRGPSGPMLNEVFGEPGSAELELGVNTCNQNPRAEVEETVTEVRISMVADEIDGDGAGDCSDGTRVTLDEPLRDREVIDNATGESVEVLSPDST